MIATGSDQTAELVVENGECLIRLDGEEQAALPVDDGWGMRLCEEISRLDRGETTEQNWTMLAQAFEVVDGHRQSIRRRRTIELYFETQSERALFKTQMAAMGCGVLTFTLFGLVLYLLVGELFAPPRPGPYADAATRAQYEDDKPWFDTVMHVLRILWILPLVLFIIAQGLLAITRPARSAESSPDESADV